MIVVTLVDGDVVEFDDATRFSTEDVFNNLCVWKAVDRDPDHDQLLHVFADGRWIGVGVDAESS